MIGQSSRHRRGALHPPVTMPTNPEPLAQLRVSWDELRQIIAGWTDADLERPWWTPFMGGNWLTARNGLQWALGHDWSEFMQLSIHTVPLEEEGSTSQAPARSKWSRK